METDLQSPLKSPLAMMSVDHSSATCVFCGSEKDQAEPLNVSADHWVVRCNKCGIYRTHPITKNTAAFYQESYYSRQKSRRFAVILEWGIRWFRWVRAWDLHKRYKQGRILDVGCGRGLMLSYMQKFLKWDVQGTQISQTAYEYATKVLGIPVYLGDLLTLPNNRPFTVVTMYHVLEHVVDPASYLAEIHSLLTDDGACVIEVPNTGSLAAGWTGRHWFGWDLPYHTFHFSSDSATRLLEEKGFRVEKIKHWSLEFNTFTVLQSFLNTIFKEKDYLFRLLQRKARISYQPARALACLLLGGILLPAALIVAIVGSAAGKGEVIRLYCRKTPR
jgi:2-polyprenyl-3-methyl-5-hydroxy-6-metoxy-1,4-benzoquinol methylase